MRLVSNLCRHCLLSRNGCAQYKQIRQVTKNIKVTGTLRYRCPEYYKLFPIGTRVEIELKQLADFGDLNEPYEPPEKNWISAGWAVGSIIEHRNDGKGFFRILLDKPVILCLPPPKGEGGWEDAKSVEVTVRLKRANNIKLLKGV